MARMDLARAINTVQLILCGQGKEAEKESRKERKGEKKKKKVETGKINMASLQPFRKRTFVVGGHITAFIGAKHPDFIWKKTPRLWEEGKSGTWRSISMRQ